MLEQLDDHPLELAELGSEVRQALEAGDSLLDAVDGVAERGERRLTELVDPVAELAGMLGELVSMVGEEFGEFGGRVGELLSAGLEQVGQGAEWLAEHPDVVTAALRLCALVAFGVENPEQLTDLLLSQPGAIESLLESCKPLFEALG